MNDRYTGVGEGCAQGKQSEIGTDGTGNNMSRRRSTTSTAASSTNSNDQLLGIPLSVWIHRAREYSLSTQQSQGGVVDYYYVELAVTVALELTNHLCEVVEEIRSKEATDATTAAAVPPSSPLRLDNFSDDDLLSGHYDFPLSLLDYDNDDGDAGSAGDDNLCSKVNEAAVLPLLKVEHITPENVIVSIGVAGTTTAAHVVTGAHIQVGLSHLTDYVEFDDYHHHPLTQQNVCYALGKILLHIFSQGDTFDFHLLLLDLGFDINNEVIGSPPLKDSSPGSSSSQSSLSSPSKKLSRRTANDAKSATLEFMKAKAFLEERGLPRSICELVADLLRAKEEEEKDDDNYQAILSLIDAQFDLLQMKTHPSRFLHDNTCSTMALDMTSLFSRSNNEKLYGRDKEMNLLMESAARIHLHTSSQSGGGISSGGPHQQQQGTHNFICDVVLLSGYSGCGKTSIVKKFTSFINANDWFVLTCEFDRQVAPISLLLQSVDLFLARFVIQGPVKRVQKIQLQFDRIFNCATLTVDKESHAELCELMPSFRSLFPTSSFDFACERTTRNNGSIGDHASSTSRAVGSGINRLKYLFRLIFNAICNGGCPVSYVFDDLQWSDSTTMDIIKEIIQPAVDGSLFSSSEDFAKRGLLFLGSFRKNELDESTLIDQLKPIGVADIHINLSSIYVDELSEQEINKMLSHKFCLQLRQTRLLAQTVYQKTRGHPLYTAEFLRSIINNGMMAFSIKDRRWVWDETLIDLQMISEGVAELLTRKLQQLHRDVIIALKVVSCIGMVDITTIKLLDCGQFVPDMFDSLYSAVQEGIVDRAGSIFAFTHDLLQESTLNLMRECDRNLLRKQIGKSLVVHPMIVDNAAICCLAVQQINMCKDVDCMLDDSERALFARLNLASGKHSFAASSYEQARDYFEAGISLLHSDPWNQQYSLCLELFEMSAVVDLMDGNFETVSMKLDCILSNSKSFDDSLNAHALRAKFLASQGQFGDAIQEIVGVLSSLGEDFPGDITSSYLLNEISVTQTILKDTSKDTLLNLPPMKDMQKLNTMKFMGIFLSISIFSSPLQMALYCCRMMRLTLKFGVCDDTITGVAHVSYAMVLYGEDFALATRFARIAESLIKGHPQEHTLLAKLTHIIATTTILVEPFQAVMDKFLKAFNSSLIVGDLDSAAMMSVFYCLVCIYVVPNLENTPRILEYFVSQNVKHRRKTGIYSLMCFSNICTAFRGCAIESIEGIKDNSDLLLVSEETNNSFLLHHILIGQMYLDCYFRNYSAVVDYGEKYRTTRRNKGERRALDIFHSFFEGLSALCLARTSNESKWHEIGNQSVKMMTKMANECSDWNFRNKLHLLQAELYYHDGKNILAENSFKASIVSAHDHGFHHEEALACELYGIFLVDTKNIVVGIEQLNLAIHKYIFWGALNKVNDVKVLIDKTLSASVAMIGDNTD